MTEIGALDYDGERSYAFPMRIDCSLTAGRATVRASVRSGLRRNVGEYLVIPSDASTERELVIDEIAQYFRQGFDRHGIAFVYLEMRDAVAQELARTGL